MPFGTALDQVPGLAQHQVVRTEPGTLRGRLQPAPGGKCRRLIALTGEP